MQFVTIALKNLKCVLHNAAAKLFGSSGDMANFHQIQTEIKEK